MRYLNIDEFYFKKEEISVVKGPVFERNSKNNLCVFMYIWIKGQKEPFSYSSEIKKAEYETVEIEKKFLFFKYKTQHRRLVKYSPEVYMEFDETKEFIVKFNQYVTSLDKEDSH